MKPLILATGSRYKRYLIDKLGIPVVTHSADVDETRLTDEAPATLVERLSRSKAAALLTQYPDHLIVGSDQVAEVDGRQLGKPHVHAAAVEQLTLCSNRRVLFHTGLCLHNSTIGTQRYMQVITEVKFRSLNREQIERYLTLEQPYDCAGSFKSEGLGICLFEYIRGDDPNALVGLPLIALVSLLAEEGITLPLINPPDSSGLP